MKTIGIIGTGMSGITAAFYLKDHFKVELFDKSRGVGGRIATRRAENGDFDHGAPFFSITSHSFKQFLNPLFKSNCISPWLIRSVQLESQKKQQASVYVGTPSMNHMMKYFKSHLHIKTQTHIQDIKKRNNKWQLFDENHQQLGDFDWVISTAPVAQTKAIIPPHISFYNQLENYAMHGKIVTMVQTNNLQDFNFDVAYSTHARIEKIIVNSAKPQRVGATGLVIHASNAYSAHIINGNSSVDPADVAQDLHNLIDLDPKQITHIQSHPWRYAQAKTHLKKPFLVDQSECIGVCGDWLIESDVEKAYDSGYALAMNILREY